MPIRLRPGLLVHLESFNSSCTAAHLDNLIKLKAEHAWTKPLTLGTIFFKTGADDDLEPSSWWCLGQDISCPCPSAARSPEDVDRPSSSCSDETARFGDDVDESDTQVKFVELFDGDGEVCVPVVAMQPLSFSSKEICTIHHTIKHNHARPSFQEQNPISGQKAWYSPKKELVMLRCRIGTRTAKRPQLNTD